MKIYVSRVLKLGLAVSLSVSLTACDLSQIVSAAQAATSEVSSKSTSSESSSDSSSTSARGVSVKICDGSLTDFSSVQSELSSFLSGLLSSLQSKESSAADDDKALERIQNLEEKVSNDLAVIDDATELTSEVQSVIERICNSRHGKKGRAPDKSRGQNSCSAVEDLAKLSFSERQGKLIDRLNEFLAKINSNDERSERIFADLDIVKGAESANDEYLKIERRAFCRRFGPE